VTNHVSDSLSDSGLSLTDAAAQLGISERTVIRRIKDGTITGKKIGEGRGGVWRVYLDGLSDRPAPVSDSHRQMSDSVSDTQPASPEVLRLLQLLEDERQDRAALVQRNEQLAGQLGFVQAKLQAAEERIKLLEAPKDEQVPEPEPEPVKRSWWRRVLGG
jgi:hypothetical protein